MLNAAGQGIDSHATADFCIQDFQKVGFHEKLKFARRTNLSGTRKKLFVDIETQVCSTSFSQLSYIYVLNSLILYVLNGLISYSS